MPTNAIIRLLTKDSTWHTANAALVLGLGRVIFLSGSNPMRSKIGDGTTALSDLVWTDEIVHDFITVKSSNGHKWKFTVGDDGMLQQPGEDLGT